MILLLDTTRGTDIRIGLMAGRLSKLRTVFDRPGSYLVPMIDELLRKQKVSVKDIKGIIVATGPGPFSALRSGVSVANALGLALQVPVVGVAGQLTMLQLVKQGSILLKRVKVGGVIVPAYGQPPNISKKKKTK